MAVGNLSDWVPGFGGRRGGARSLATAGPTGSDQVGRAAATLPFGARHWGSDAILFLMEPEEPTGHHR